MLLHLKQRMMNVVKRPGSDLWHDRMGHPSLKVIDKMTQDCDLNISYSDTPEAVDCGTCVRTKTVRGPMKDPISAPHHKPGNLITSDLCGPMPVKSYDGSKYFITFMDSSSKYLRLVNLPSKEGD